ncbi:MAG: hypothetical protein U5K56_14830 [Halioglobus sp.]|nr:hypothetical protein [Halioglobus sp.]
MTEHNARAPNAYNPWQRELTYIAQWRLCAWLPWLLLHIPASWIIVAGEGPRGDLTAWLVYALLSWVACLIVIVVYFFRRGDILSYFVAGTLWIGGPLLSATYEENINPTPTGELRRWCEKDAGLEIHRVVRANGYFDAWASSHHSPWQIILDTDYEFIEVCDSTRRSYRPLSKPGCWRVTKVRRDSQAMPRGNRCRDQETMKDSSVRGIFTASMLRRRKAGEGTLALRYGLVGGFSAWEIDNAWHSIMYRYTSIYSKIFRPT